MLDANSNVVAVEGTQAPAITPPGTQQVPGGIKGEVSLTEGPINEMLVASKTTFENMDKTGYTADQLKDIEARVQAGMILNDSVINVDDQQALHTISFGTDKGFDFWGGPLDREVVQVDTQKARAWIEARTDIDDDQKFRELRALQIIAYAKNKGLELIKTKRGNYWFEGGDDSMRKYAINGIKEVKDVLDAYVKSNGGGEIPGEIPGEKKKDITIIDPNIDTDPLLKIVDPNDATALVADVEELDGFDKYEIAYLSSIALDLGTSIAGTIQKIASPGTAGVSYATGAITSLVGGLSATGIRAWADFTNPEVSNEEAWKNLGFSVGMEAIEAVSFVPASVLQTFKYGTKTLALMKKALRLGAVAIGLSATVELAYSGVIDKISNGEDMTVDDWRTLATAVAFIGSAIVTGASGKRRVKGMKKVLAGDTSVTPKAGTAKQLGDPNIPANQKRLPINTRKVGAVDNMPPKSDGVTPSGIRKLEGQGTKPVHVNEKGEVLFPLLDGNGKVIPTTNIDGVTYSGGATKTGSNIHTSGAKPASSLEANVANKPKTGNLQHQKEIDLLVEQVGRKRASVIIKKAKRSGDIENMSAKQLEDMGANNPSWFTTSRTKWKKKIKKIEADVKREKTAKAKTDKKTRELAEDIKATKETDPRKASALIEQYKTSKGKGKQIDKKITAKEEALKKVNDSKKNAIYEIAYHKKAAEKTGKLAKGVYDGTVKGGKALFTKSTYTKETVKVLKGKAKTAAKALNKKFLATPRRKRAWKRDGAIGRFAEFGRGNRRTGITLGMSKTQLSLGNQKDERYLRSSQYDRATIEYTLTKAGFDPEEFDQYSHAELSRALELYNADQKGRARRGTKKRKKTKKHNGGLFYVSGSVQKAQLGLKSLRFSRPAVDYSLPKQGKIGFPKTVRWEDRYNYAGELSNPFKAQEIAIDPKGLFNIDKIVLGVLNTVGIIKPLDPLNKEGDKKNGEDTGYTSPIGAAKYADFLNWLPTDLLLPGPKKFVETAPVLSGVAPTVVSRPIENMPGLESYLGTLDYVPRIDSSDSMKVNAFANEAISNNKKAYLEAIIANSKYVSQQKDARVAAANANTKAQTDVENARIQRVNEGEMIRAQQNVAADAQLYAEKSKRWGQSAKAIQQLAVNYADKRGRGANEEGYIKYANLANIYKSEYLPKINKEGVTVAEAQGVKSQFEDKFFVNPDNLNKYLAEYTMALQPSKKSSVGYK